MATIKEDISLKYQTTTDSDVEEASFSAGQEVTLVQTWADYYLIKDDDGRYYNIPKDKLEE